MVTKIRTVAFQGVEAIEVEVQCALAPGLPGFSIVGLPDKSVTEARERVRAAFAAVSVALPAKRVTINLAPADLPKEGAHFDLPIALAVLAAMGAIPPERIEGWIALGELSLDGRLVPVRGTLPAALCAATLDLGLICPAANGPEAAWVAAAHVIAPASLHECVQHLSGLRPLHPAQAGRPRPTAPPPDLREVRGQERAKRALEIAAAGGHHLLMTGPPGAGKSMLAARLPGLMPPLTPHEALETSMIQSVAGMIEGGAIASARPFRAPHHTASTAAMIGGGRAAAPGEVSLAHNGVLFLDELPEFPRAVLETLRQPLETREVVVARASAHVTYPCRLLLIAAANPCRCGYLGDAARACRRAPACAEDYMGRLSGPLLDRFDLRIEVPAVTIAELDQPPSGETTETVAARILDARARQNRRYAAQGLTAGVNAVADGPALEQAARLDDAGRALLSRAAERLGLSARGYHRVLRVARTIADLDGADTIAAPHLAEALSYRMNDATGPLVTRP